MPWAILSAEHGMVDPETILEPYDRCLGKESAAFRRRWSKDVAAQALARLRQLDLSAVEIPRRRWTAVSPLGWSRQGYMCCFR
jgi:hypothetical protein